MQMVANKQTRTRWKRFWGVPQRQSETITRGLLRQIHRVTLSYSISGDHFVTTARDRGGYLPDAEVLRSSLASSITTKSFWEFMTKAFTDTTTMQKNPTKFSTHLLLSSTEEAERHEVFRYHLWVVGRMEKGRSKEESGCKTPRDPVHPNHWPQYCANLGAEAALLQKSPQDTKRRRWQTCDYCPLGRGKEQRGKKIIHA